MMFICLHLFLSSRYHMWMCCFFFFWRHKYLCSPVYSNIHRSSWQLDETSRPVNVNPESVSRINVLRQFFLPSGWSQELHRDSCFWNRILFHYALTSCCNTIRGAIPNPACLCYYFQISAYLVINMCPLERHGDNEIVYFQLIAA